jgi:hypothetical protein
MDQMVVEKVESQGWCSDKFMMSCRWEFMFVHDQTRKRRHRGGLAS